MNRGGARRGHLSHRVPNVKLRPAPARDPRDDDQGSNAAESSSRGARRAEEERQNALARQEVLQSRAGRMHAGGNAGDDGEEEEEGKEDPKTVFPLAGLVICVTGIDQRRDEISRFAQTMGARHERDLVEDVTHLIANQPGSLKYRCAVKLGMKVVEVGWIDAVRQLWIDAKPVDLETITEEYSMKPLHGFKIALTGFGEDTTRSHRMARSISALGGQLDPSFRPDAGITHVICGTDNLAHSNVLTYLDSHRATTNDKGKANATTAPPKGQPWAVRPEWLEDCKEAGVMMDEWTYSIWEELPPNREALVREVQLKQFRMDGIISSRMQAAQKRKSQAGKSGGLIAANKRRKMQASSVSLSDRSSPAKPLVPTSMIEDIAHKSRLAAAGADAKEPSKWRSASEKASLGEKDSPLKKTASDAPPTNPFASRQGSSSAGAQQVRPPLRNSQEVAGKPPRDSDATSPAVRDGAAKRAPLVQETAHKESAAATSLESAIEESFLRETRVRLHPALADAPTFPRMQAAVKSAGGSIVEDPTSSAVDFTIVPWTHVASEKETTSGEVVTPFWLELCVHSKRRVSPDEYIGCRPARVALPLPEGQLLSIHLSGFSVESIDRHAINSVVRKIGGKVSSMFASKDTHLLVADHTSDDNPKVLRAKTLGIPVVKLSFLEKCLQEGVVDPPPQPPSATAKRRFSQRGETPMPATGMPLKSTATGPSLSGRRSTGRKSGSSTSASHRNDGQSAATSALAQQMKAVLEKDALGVRKTGRKRPRPRAQRPGGSVMPSETRSRSTSVLDMDEEDMPMHPMDEEDGKEEVNGIVQTQVVVSYDDPKALREQRRFLAMVNGDAPGRTLARSESGPSTLQGNGESLLESRVSPSKANDLPAAQSDSRRTRSAIPAKPIKARNQPGTKR